MWRAEIEDVAGNRSEASDVTPGCFVAERRVAGRHSRVMAQLRDTLGRPTVVVGDRDVLEVRQWDGTEWRTTAAAVHPGDVYRGRMDSARLADGTLAFCATRRAGIRDPSSAVWDLYDPRAAIDLVLIAPDGAISAQTLSGPALALGCGMQFDAARRQLVISGTRAFEMSCATSASRTHSSAAWWVWRAHGAPGPPSSG